MKFFKNGIVLSLILSFASCNQSTSNKDNVVSKNTAKESKIDTSKTNSKLAGKSYEQYGMSFCELINTDVITSVFPDASDIKAKESTDRSTPECEVTFISNEDRIGLILKGQSKKNNNFNLEWKLENEKGWTKIEGLGDEAYFFPWFNGAKILVLKNNLRYNLQMNSLKNSAKEDAIAIMKTLFKTME
ncbi:hypothetical protein [Psychroserpens damuponensis]|uniref:hypothetical protein n=1 Tax=Psychroserpens damuponensis TaxID=943936 RepID=UPI00058B47C3|nr:hypothetical protein [Psychroserpens damuponensis]